MYFPAYPPLRLSTPPGSLEEWLEVPWKHITHIRVAREVGERGQCVAFDVPACAAESARFFEAVGTPRDRRGPSTMTVSLAYGGWPRAPARVVRQMLSLRLRSAALAA